MSPPDEQDAQRLHGGTLPGSAPEAVEGWIPPRAKRGRFSPIHCESAIFCPPPPPSRILESMPRLHSLTARSRFHVLRDAALVTWLGSGVVAAALALWISRANDWPTGGDTLLLAGDLVLVYAALYGVVLGSVAVLSLALGKRPGLRLFVAAFVAFTVLLNGIARFITAVQFVSVTPHMTAIGLLDLPVILLASAAVGLGCASPRRKTASLGVSVSAALLLALTAVHAWHEKPLVRDLAAWLPPILATTQPPAPAPVSERFEGMRGVVLGLDGISWEIVVPMLARGELPHLRALLDGAAYGYLDTLSFAISPVVWETISTGQPPERHGIGYHAHFEFPGVSRAVRFLPRYPLSNSVMFARRLTSLASRLGFVRQRPAGTTDARAARLWEVASRAGIRVGVYDWLNTSPVSPVRGFVHGYGPVQPQTFPLDQEQGLAPLPENPDGIEAGLAWVLAKEPYERASFERCLGLALRERPELLLFYTHFPDAVNHLNWKQETHGEAFFISGRSHPAVDPGPAVSEVMRFLDRMIGDVRARLPADAWLAIVSDHGFDFRGYEHDNSPPGVIILRGPGIAPGPLVGASVFDVAPTLLHWLGLPIADDMPGGVLAVAEPGGPLDRVPLRVATHGPATPPLGSGKSGAEALRRHEEYLRSLGYVN